MTYPWPPPSAGEWPQLLRLRPEDVGYDSHIGPGLGTKHLHSNSNEVEGDPLVSLIKIYLEIYKQKKTNFKKCFS